MDDQKLTDARKDIPFLRNGIYVDNASVSPPSRCVQLASQKFDTIVSEQLRKSKAIAQPYFDRGRALAAKLAGSSPQSIAYIQNTSHGLPLVALGREWLAGEAAASISQMPA